MARGRVPQALQVPRYSANAALLTLESAQDWAFVAQVLRQIRVLVKAVERAGQVREAVPQALELAIRLQAETRLGARCAVAPASHV